MSKISRDKKKSIQVPPPVVYAVAWEGYESGDVESLHLTKEGAEKAVEAFKATNTKLDCNRVFVRKMEIFD